MPTKEQALAATGDELSKLAGEVLQPSSCILDRKTQDKSPGEYLCRTCNVWTDNPKAHTSAMPIPLTWPEAMKWRDWAVGEYKDYGEAFHKAMWDVCCANSEHGQSTAFSYWLANTAQPEHYIKAACLCKLGGE